MSVSKRFAALGALTVASVLMTACGSSNNAGGANSSSASGTSITVAYAAPGAEFADLYVGVENGIFKKHGLNVTLKQVTPTNLVPGILSGSVQIGGGVADGTASTILKGESLKYVTLSAGTYNLQLWANPKIKTAQDLMGHTVAMTTQGSETDFALTDFLKVNNIPDSSVNRKYLVTAPQMISAMTSGAVDAGLFQPPTAQTLAKDGDSVISSLSNLPYAVGAYIAQADYIKNNPQVMKEFVAAETENLAFLQSNPTGTIAAIQKDSGNTNAADAKIAYDFFIHVWKKDPTVTPALIQAAFQRAAMKAKVAPPASVDQYIYTPTA